MKVYSITNTNTIFSAMAIVIAKDEIDALKIVQEFIVNQNAIGEYCHVFFDEQPIEINFLPCFAEGESKVIAYHEDGG